MTPRADAEPLTIRPAVREDTPVLGRLGALLVGLHRDFDPKRFIAPSSGTERAYGEFLGREMKRDGVVLLVAERDGEVVGYAYAALEGNDWMALRGPAGVLHDLVVDPQHRREGVGRRLVEAVVEQLDVQGAPRIVLSAADRNQVARRLFASLGFRRTMVEMTRDLDQD